MKVLRGLLVLGVRKILGTIVSCVRRRVLISPMH